MTAIPLTEISVRAVKRVLATRYPAHKSTHLTEAVAAACGFNSHAALLASANARDSADPDYVLLKESSFWQRLEEITGQRPTAGDKKLAFDLLAYPQEAGALKTSSARKPKVDYAKSTRLRAWRNAMVAAINAGLEQRLFGVRPGDNRWPGYTPDRNRQRPHIYRFMLGIIPVIASVDDAGFDELSIHVGLWPTPDADRHIGAGFAGFSTGEVWASGWLERKDGAWLQTGGAGPSAFRARRARLDAVAAFVVEPQGYADGGDFKM
jgi:hypothetical protein